jgi:hypothetical protein
MRREMEQGSKSVGIDHKTGVEKLAFLGIHRRQTKME